MRKATIPALVFGGLAAFAFAVPAMAKDIVLSAGPVKFDAIAGAVRDVPAGNPMPGIHIDAKVNGRAMDIYIAPMDFAVRYGIKVSKGEYVRIVGTLQAGETDVVLAREITTGNYDQGHNVFRPTLTMYLRNDEGPLWAEAKPID
jgi:hypothetical protein